MNPNPPLSALRQSLAQVWGRESWRILTLPLFLLIVLPILAVFLRLTPADMLASLRQEQAQAAIRLSLVTTTTTVAITLVFGTPVAYLLHRRRSPWTRLLDSLIDLPTVLPPAVAGVALLMAFGRQGLIGQSLSGLGITIPFSTLAVVLAQTFIASPFYIRSTAVGFASVNCELKKAAALDGANRWQIFRYIMLPIALNSVLSGSIMTWARALGEFGATIIFAGNLSGRTQTMPLAIYIGFEVDLTVALTLSGILILFSFLVLIAIKMIVHDHLEGAQDCDSEW